MPTLLATEGNGNGASKGLVQRPGTSVLYTSTGGVIIVHVDTNNAAANASYGDQTGVAKIEVWHSTDRVNFTQVATVTPTTAVQQVPVYAADLYNDNSVAIVWRTASGLRFRKVTFSTWAVGAEQTISAQPTSGNYEAIDVSVSDSDTVLVAGQIIYTTGTIRSVYRLYGQRSGLGTWEQIGTDYTVPGAGASASTVLNGQSIAVAWAKGTVAANTRAFMVCVSSTITTADLGFSIIVDQTVENATLTSGARSVLTQGIGIGTYPTSGGQTTWARACRVANTPVDNEFLVGMGSVFTYPKSFATKWTRSAGVWTNTIPVSSYGYVYNPLTKSSGFASTSTVSSCTISIGIDAINFVYGNKYQYSYTIPWSHVAKVNTPDSPQTITWDGDYVWNNDSSPPSHVYLLQGGNGKNSRLSRRHDMAFSRVSTANGTNGAAFYHQGARDLPAPVAHTPSAGSAIATSTPPLTADADTGLKLAQVGIRGQWEFATDALYTTNLRVFTSGNANITKVAGTDVAGKVVKLTDVLSSTLELTQTSWFMRSALVDSFGNRGSYFDPAATFTVSHPPATGSLEPSGDQILMYGAGNVKFTWKFSDPSTTDSQTAFQVVVENNVTGASVLDSGKITSTANSYIGAIPVGSKDTNLRWTVRVWDKNDVAGAYAEYETFYIADPPVLDLYNPIVNSTVTSGRPSSSFTVTVGGGRTITKVRWIYTQGSVVIHDTGWFDMSLPSGGGAAYVPPVTIVKNNQNYSVQAFVTDSLGLEGQSAIVPFSVAFTPPAAPSGVAVNTATFNSESAGGYVDVTWTDTARDADFITWIVYRKDDVIDPGTQNVIQAGVYNEIGRVYETATTYSFKDYYAPSSYKSNYLVTQLVNRFGDEVESANTTPTSVFPISDGYWLIELTSVPVVAIRLSIVTSDEFTDEWEEEEYTVIGRGRHYDRGDHYGVKGSLTVQIRDNEGVSARQKKNKLEQIKEENLDLFMRNPFGDLFRVYVGNLQIGRIAGVGASEFVDVTIPYAEVSS